MKKFYVLLAGFMLWLPVMATPAEAHKPVKVKYAYGPPYGKWHHGHHHPHHVRKIYVYRTPPVHRVYIDRPYHSRYCREYQTMTRVGGHSRPSYGRACMQPDGSWKIVYR